MHKSGIIIIGGGGHAGVVIDSLHALGKEIIGICDPNLPVGKHLQYPVEVLGGDDILDGVDPANIALINGIGSVKPSTIRSEVETNLKAKGFLFETVIHPSSIIADSAIIKESVQIMAGVVVQSYVEISSGTIINTRTSVDHHCKIGPFNHLAPGVTFSGNVCTSNNVHVGTGASVIENIQIGAGAFIRAGEIVIKDVPTAARFHTKKP